MKHVRKQLLSKTVVRVILLLSLFVANSSYALVDGKPFSELPNQFGPRHNIQEFANATVGVVTDDGICTGIRVSKSTIMTAAHCLNGADQGDVTIITYDLQNGLLEIKLHHSDFQIMISDVFKMYAASDSSVEVFSSDVGIINIGHLPSALDNDSYINIRTPGQIVTTIEDLNDYMFNPNTNLYGFSWGGHKNFEYATQTTRADIKSNTTYVYSTDHDKKYTNSWSYLLSEFNRYKLPNYRTALTLNYENKIYGYSPYEPYWEEFAGDDGAIPAEKFTNTSVIFLTSVINDTDSIISQPGDSGGGIVACHDQVGNDCSLIGIIGSGIGDRMSRITTTANPIAKNLLLK